MAQGDFAWALKFMRSGYAGRGLTYTVVAGLSLWALWQGGEAEGTSSALAKLETDLSGQIALTLIGLGLLAYTVWRLTSAIYDLEDYGNDGEGLVARLGQVSTGLIHGVLGLFALSLVLIGASGGGNGSAIADIASTIMRWPLGRWLIAAAGLATLGAGAYYVVKAWKESYRKHLRGNKVTANWNWVLKLGVLAQAIVILIIGTFLTYAGLTANPDEAAGLDGVWEFLAGQPFGRVLTLSLCVGLLCFAVFCFVNAAYRIVPKAADADVTTLAVRLERKIS